MWFWGALLGASMGLQDRANDEMARNGIRPSWSQRHQILALLLWVVGMFAAVIVWINLAVAWPHPVMVATAVVVGVVLVATCIAAYRRAERRWGDPYQGTRLVSQRAIGAAPRRAVGGALTLLGVYALAGVVLAALFWLL